MQVLRKNMRYEWAYLSTDAQDDANRCLKLPCTHKSFPKLLAVVVD